MLIQHQVEGERALNCFINGSLRSPLLLVGPRGVGRRSSIITAVKRVFCNGSKGDDCRCSSCYTLGKGYHVDLTTLSFSSNKMISVEDVREMIDSAKNYPSVAPLRCFIIDGADYFTIPAANAFLKTLEEPTISSMFFLLADSLINVLSTIQSRCCLVRYHRLPKLFVTSFLKEEDPERALIYANLGEGSLGDSLGFLRAGRLQLRNTLLSILNEASTGNLAAAFKLLDSLKSSNLDILLRFLDQILYDVVVGYLGDSYLINIDRKADIDQLRSRSFDWIYLSRQVEELRYRVAYTKLNTAFHLKTYLAGAV